jgi:hypothetical protein
MTIVLVALGAWLLPFVALALWSLWLADRATARITGVVAARTAAIEPCACRRGDEDTAVLPRRPLGR